LKPFHRCLISGVDSPAILDLHLTVGGERRFDRFSVGVGVKAKCRKTGRVALKLTDKVIYLKQRVSEETEERIEGMKISYSHESSHRHKQAGEEYNSRTAAVIDDPFSVVVWTVRGGLLTRGNGSAAPILF
jgi:hypothetical protein